MPTTALAEIDAQYRQLREGCAVAPRDSLRPLRVHGDEAGEYLQSQLTNDIDLAEPGSGVYAALLNRKARILADMRVLCITAADYLLVLEQEGFQAALEHLDMYRIGRQAEVAEPDPPISVVSLIGPGLEDRTGLVPGPEFQHRQATVAGQQCIAVSAPIGDTPAFDLLIEAANVDALLAALASDDVPRVSEEAIEILRIEAGTPRFGHEVGPAVMPAEAGIVERAVNFEKGCYIGQEPVARLHYRGRPNRLLRKLALSAPAAVGATLKLEDRELGALTSSCISPANGALGLAVVRREAEPGTIVEVGEDGTTAVIQEVETA